MNSLTNNSGRKLFFRKFTRKKFSVFLSLRKVVHISNLTLAYSLVISPLTTVAQEDSSSVSQTYDLEEVEVVGQLTPSVLQELPRLVSVLSLSEIEHSPSQSLTDLLSYAANIDIRQRGKAGIQSDISIRGGSFDHNLVLLNGINISDPQTGHLSLNLPFETDAIYRIEVLNGPAARVHGANAFAGAVNFVTRPSKLNSLSLSSRFGDFGYFANAITLNYSNKKTRNLLHYNNSFSSGYTSNTDFKRHGLFYHGQFDVEEGMLELQMAYSDKGFGSNGFYTPRFPDHYEQNQQSFFSVGYKSGKKIMVHPEVYWRRHRDRWEMFRVDDDWYRVENGKSISNNPGRTAFDTSFVYTNHHINDVLGARFNISVQNVLGKTTLGMHVRSESIISNTIGYDKGLNKPVRGFEDFHYILSDMRSNFDMHFEHKLELENLLLSGGFLVNWNSYLPDEINIFPGIDLRYRLVESLYLQTSYNYTLGVPTFTDLTYEDPNHIGNNDLVPYSQHSFEGGLVFATRALNFSAIYFHSFGNNIIDWVWLEESNSFSPINIPKYKSQGIEITTKMDLRDIPLVRHILSTASINYTFIDMDKDVEGEILKYSNIRHKMSASFSKKIGKALSGNVNLNYTDRNGGFHTFNSEESNYNFNPFKSYFLVDVRLTYSYKDFTFHAEATNLFDKKYIDVGSINQPGRWISGGVKFKLSGF